MSLLTPPRTAHREEKENRRPPTRMVVWKEEHQIHTLTAANTRRPLTPFQAPGRSILKKTAYTLLPYESEPQRKTTPEPSDPLADLHYLEGPVARIIAVDAALRDLVESYSVLAARLRACVSGNTDADASWPLFQPLRKHRDALVSAMCRDLGRALEVPLSKEDVEDEARFLPSPEKSPKKKGMSAEGVKYARDLCTTCHSVLKLLSAIFTLPAVYGIFEDAHLSELLTATLAISLAPELPTPNARKTYALSIWLLQFQRLPSEVLLPARDRIAYALRRGIEGELGKEGKKGSTSDGLKAIHDLSICYPSIFVPAFTDLLPSIFAQLLAPTLVLRTQACHALGGYAYGLASLPSSAVHSRAANYTATYLTKAPLGTPSKKPSSPTKDPAIIRTLRTTLGATEPKHVAQGPVWALSLLACFIVMLGPQVYLDERMSKCITALSALATRHSRSSVRSLACLVWRGMTWAYFRPLPVKLSVQDDIVGDESQDAVEDSEGEEYSEDELQLFRRRIIQGWKILSSMVDMGAAVSTIGALFTAESPSDNERRLRWGLSLLAELSKRGGYSCQEALWTVGQLVSRFSPNAVEDPVEYDLSKLLPLGLFSANPGLLTAEYTALAPVVKGLIKECPHIDEVRALTEEEITTGWVFDCLMQVWSEGLRALKMGWGEPFPPEILTVWSSLLKAKVTAAQGDELELNEFAIYVAAGLTAILQDNSLDISSKQDVDDRLLTLTSPAGPSHSHAHRALPVYRWKSALRLLLVRQLWLIVVSILPSHHLSEAAETLLAVLLDSEVNLVVDLNLADDVRAQWASLCAEVAYHCDEQELLAFWNMQQNKADSRRKAGRWNENIRSFVWSHFLEKWREEQSKWESAAILLGAPLLDSNAWDMASDDLDEWKAFLEFTVDRALDYGVDSTSVVDYVASLVVGQPSLSSTASTRVSELLLCNLDMAEARSLPSALFDLTNDTLVNTYPPTTPNKVPSLWLLRTLTRSVDACPVEILEQVLETLQEGMCQWILDEQCVLTGDEYAMDVLPMYQTALARMIGLPQQSAILNNLASLVQSALCGRSEKSEGAVEAFVEFWNSTYASISEPEEGWPEKINYCLAIAGLRSLPTPEVPDSPVSENGDADDAEVESQLLTDNCPSPVVPSPGSLAEAFVPHHTPASPSHDEIVLAMPSKFALSSPKTPRPKKSTSPTRPLAPPVFSISPSRPLLAPSQRSPTTPKRRTPGSVRIRSEKYDKENTSPLRSIVSVTERIAGRSPSVSMLGKRRFDAIDDEVEPDEKTKRFHHDVSYIFGDALHNSPIRQSIQVNMVQLSPLVSPIKPAAAPDLSPLSHTERLPALNVCVKPSSRRLSSASHKIAEQSKVIRKNRDSVVLDAVEVPTLREVMKRRSASFNISTDNLGPSYPLPQSRSLPVESSSLRRTRSSSKLLENTSSSNVLQPVERKRAAPPRPSHGVAGKRKRIAVLSQEDVFSISSSLSSPLRRLKEMQTMGSDDSINMATPSLTMGSSNVMSSDDDPHRFLGQVTPHRLVSPVIRHVLDDPFAEPGSDDSNLSASPTSERVARMRSRKALPARPLSSPLVFSSDNQS